MGDEILLIQNKLNLHFKTNTKMTLQNTLLKNLMKNVKNSTKTVQFF